MGAELFDVAALVLSGYDIILRSQEMFLMRVAHVRFLHAQRKVVVKLPRTKTSRRKNAVEFVESKCQVTYHALWTVCKSLPRHATVLHRSPAQFRQIFRMLCDTLMLFPLANVYSLRRGGATWDFFKHGSMETTLLRGRWQSSSAAARVYVTDAAAAVVDYSLSSQQTALLTEAGALLLGLGAGRTRPVW